VIGDNAYVSESTSSVEQSLEDVLTTDELERRPRRAADYEAETRALRTLVEELAANPAAVLQKVVEMVAELCNADSAGISIREGVDESGILRWGATGGRLAKSIGDAPPADVIAAGDATALDEVLLLREPARYFSGLRSVEPPIHESLVAPWTHDGNTVGVLWAIAQTPSRKFDGEDARLLASLARFGAAVWQTALALTAPGGSHAARERREELERDFVANAAHELRTPLTGVVASIEALAAGAIDRPTERDRFFGHLRREAARLTRLCNSLLLLTQVDTTRELPKDAVPIRELLEDVAADLDPKPAVEVRVDAPADLTLETNRGLIERVVANLAENAVKNTVDGRIDLCAFNQDGAAVVEVRDTGSGIGGSDPRRAFERFYRGGARSADGFGLGLSIAQQAARAIGGDLELVSRDGEGTVARLTLGAERASSA
jgi:signal transduction histidine kinase